MRIGLALLFNAIFWLALATLPPLVILFILVIPGAVFYFALWSWVATMTAWKMEDEK